MVEIITKYKVGSAVFESIDNAKEYEVRIALEKLTSSKWTITDFIVRLSHDAELYVAMADYIIALDYLHKPKHINIFDPNKIDAVLSDEDVNQFSTDDPEERVMKDSLEELEMLFAKVSKPNSQGRNKG